MEYLGKQTNRPIDHPEAIPWKGGSVVVKLECSEFTSRCPVTGQPDFAELTITYSPDEWLCETKSLKLWLWSFRETSKFNEALTHAIAQKFWETIKPVHVSVTSRFNTRGGISVSTTADISI